MPVHPTKEMHMPGHPGKERAHNGCSSWERKSTQRLLILGKRVTKSNPPLLPGLIMMEDRSRSGRAHVTTHTHTHTGGTKSGFVPLVNYNINMT